VIQVSKAREELGFGSSQVTSHRLLPVPDLGAHPALFAAHFAPASASTTAAHSDSPNVPKGIGRLTEGNAEL
jgi:hypothetical protein